MISCYLAPVKNSYIVPKVAPLLSTRHPLLPGTNLKHNERCEVGGLLEGQPLPACAICERRVKQPSNTAGVRAALKGG